MPTGIYKHKTGYKRPPRSKEWSEKIGVGNKGKIRSEEFKLKISNTTKGKSNKGAFKKGGIAFNKGKKCPWAKNNPQVFKKGIVPWNKDKKGLQKHTIEHRMKLSEKFKGDKNPSWRDGVSKINKTERQLIMNTVEYKLWRESVFTRDNFTCVWCLQRGGELNADHIKPFKLFPELRFAIDNGRTLCVSCHRKTDTYGSLVNKI